MYKLHVQSLMGLTEAGAGNDTALCTMQ